MLNLCTYMSSSSFSCRKCFCLIQTRELIYSHRIQLKYYVADAEKITKSVKCQKNRGIFLCMVNFTFIFSYFRNLGFQLKFNFQKHRMSLRSTNPNSVYKLRKSKTANCVISMKIPTGSQGQASSLPIFFVNFAVPVKI